MAKVRIKNIDGVSKAIKKVFKTSAHSQKVLNEIGEFTRDRVRQQARSGKSLENNSAPKKFPNLKESTKQRRESLERNHRFKLDPDFFKARFANVTLTGQLLDALKYQISKRGLVSLFFKEKRRKMFDADENVTNSDVYKNLKKLGFGFLGLDEKGQKRVKKIVLDEFRRNIKKTF